MNHDVVIVGAGPAGSTLATLVAQAGHDVLLLEKNTFPRYKIGESLLPATVRDLADMLGVRAEFEKAGFVTKRGATFSWGRQRDTLWHLNFGGPRSEEIILDPAVPAAYNVARSEFDQILLQNAIKNGVNVKYQCTAQRLLSDNGKVSGVAYTDAEGNTVNVAARFVADASGQRSKLARQIGHRTLSKFFAKLAAWRYFDHGERLPGPLSGNTLFQAVDGVWIWYIPINDTMTSVGVVAPASAYQRGSNPDDFLGAYIDKCPLINRLLANASHSLAPPYDKTRICSEYSYCYSSFWKPGAFLLGDSACFVDVLLSSGVHLATYSAVLAAQSVNSVLAGTLSETMAMNEFETRYRREYAIFFDGLVGLYDMTKDANEYGQWLRKLLIDTSGIAFDPDYLIGTPVHATDDQAVLEQSQKNLLRMREYNSAQIAYDGDAAMLDQSIPDLPYTLTPSTDMRLWVRAG